EKAETKWPHDAASYPPNLFPSEPRTHDVNEHWRPTHSTYRRGLATNLHELGVPDKVIQAILRHEDVSTTQRSYIKTVPQVVTDAMNQLEARIARAAVVQQVSVN